jgi:hypothetical protein
MPTHTLLPVFATQALYAQLQLLQGKLVEIQGMGKFARLLNAGA